jgi:hypothetical protein
MSPVDYGITHREVTTRTGESQELVSSHLKLWRVKLVAMFLGTNDNLSSFLFKLKHSWLELT